LELQRVQQSYLILSPQPTSGDRIVVNKNFVFFDIEAEGATEVLIDGEAATKRTDIPDRFVYNYIGLRPDRATEIEITVVRPSGQLKEKVAVYYTGSVQNGSAYM